MDFINANFNLQIFDYMISHYQGKYAFTTILSTLNSTHYKSGEQIFVKNDLLKFEKMRSEVVQEQKVFFDRGKCSNDDVEYRTLKSSLEQMSMDLLNHAEKVDPIIDATDYSSDPEKVNFLVASYGRVCYQRMHQFSFNLDSAITLNLRQEAAGLQNLRSVAIQNMSNFDGFVQNTMLSKQLIPKETYIAFWEDCVSIGATLKAACHDIDMFIKLSEKDDFEYTDYPYIHQDEMASWQQLNVIPQSIGYWKACDFTPSKAAPWISVNITDPFLCLTSLKYKLTVDDTSLCMQQNIPLVLARRWIALGVPLVEGIERMKKGEMPPLVKEGERML
ncbi:MAG: hypothetical protein ACOX3T_03370 [Bdellovibrionota bacterium]